MVTRRGFLGMAGGVGVGVALAGCGGAFSSPGLTGELVGSEIPLPERFTVPLPVPKPVVPVSTAGGVDLFEVVQRKVDVEILPGVRTEALTYGGTFPGAYLETRTGRPTVVRHVNELDVPTTVHLHGGHVPTDSDGHPLDLVGPGEARDYRYPMDQRAATLWYHDHRMDLTGRQVYQGLFGLHVVRDDEDDALALPRGEREIPLVIVDRSFDEDGQFRYPADEGSASAGLPGAGPRHPGDSHDGDGGVDQGHVEGVLGDVVLVNGAPWPVLEVDAARYRFRILNGSNARQYQLSLDPPPPGGRSFLQVGSDSGLLEAPVAHDSLPVAQGERFDVVVDFSRYAVGTRVTLANAVGGAAAAEVMQFVVARRAADESAPAERLPARLSEIEPLVTTGARTRMWRFTRGTVDGRLAWTVNGRAYDPDRMDASVPLGEVEVWRFVADLHHPVHVHLDPFQVVRRRGGPPAPTDSGWKDTVSLRPGEVVDVAVRFSRFAGEYVIHCHNLEHEDRMMMAAFATT